VGGLCPHTANGRNQTRTYVPFSFKGVRTVRPEHHDPLSLASRHRRPSERVAIAAAVAEMVGERRGARSDLGQKIVRSGKPDDEIAEKAGFEAGE
jgi:hypothetical protein